MTNIERPKSGRVVTFAAIAAAIGLAVGAAAIFWIETGPSAPARAAMAEPAKMAGPCNGRPARLYRNPMGAPDTSAVPKKDSMGMDYIPVCDDSDASPTAMAEGTVKINLDRVQRLGVRSEAVEERALSRTVRAFATVQFDERKQTVIAPRFGGWIEKLLVNATGDVVTRGQPLFEVYSPELNVLQQEFLLARSMQGPAGIGDTRLRNMKAALGGSRVSSSSGSWRCARTQTRGH